MTWCFVPYKEINFYVPTGHLTYCCKHDFGYAPLIEDVSHGRELLRSPFVTKMKQELLDGNKIKICQSCWNSEEKGDKSWRNTEGEIPPDLNNRESLNAQNIYYSQVALYFDNTCDMKCVYCGPWLSSKWQAEVKFVEDNNIKAPYKFDENFEVNHDKEIYSKRITRILEFLEALGSEAHKSTNHLNLTILGGEPLLSPEIKDSNFLKYIDSFYKYANKDFSLIFTIHTNGNTPKKILDRFLNDVQTAKEKYKNLILKIIVSVDTVGKASEYIRSSSNWSAVNKNIHTYCQSSVVDQLGFSPTLTVFSITTFNEMLDYWIDLHNLYDLKINMSVGVAYNPFYQSPYNLTKDYDQYIKNILLKIDENKHCFTDISIKLLTERFEDLLVSINKNETLDEEVKKNLGKFIKYTKQIRNQDVYDYIPNMINVQ